MTTVKPWRGDLARCLCRSLVRPCSSKLKTKVAFLKQHSQSCDQAKNNRTGCGLCSRKCAGLGKSEISQRYAIASLDDAKAYLLDPVLGERLRICTQAVLDAKGRTAEQIFGAIDCNKFQSSMTLFAIAAGAGSIFEAALKKFFNGQICVLTTRLCSK